MVSFAVYILFVFLIGIMLINLFLKINSLFTPLPHPFNQTKNGAYNLNYADFELLKAPEVFAKYNRFGNFLNEIKNKKIADLACGGGGKSVYLAMNGASDVTGLDVSENFITQAQNLAKEKKVESKCHFLVQDVMKTKLKENSFDMVIFNDAIEHISDPEKSLLEAKRILKPGGKIYLNFEGYYYFFGHHLWDALPIPWLHLFTTEKFRVKLYKKAVGKFPDAKARIDFRISKNNQGKETISYLNGITIGKFEKIIKRLEAQGLSVEHRYYSTFNKKIFRILARLPILREMFLATVFYVLRKI